jgi:mannose-6-phosphate isomerase
VKYPWLEMNKICLLKNPVQTYDWGSKTEIQALIGDRGAIGKPMAELWMGAHPKSPSQVLIDGKWQFLDRVIKKDPESILGKSTAKKFSNQLPFLFKILAAERPLSVQVHPTIQMAKEGFLRENKLGIPLDSSNRSYRDSNHKPEILCALTFFHGLKGFRDIREIISLMDDLSIPTLAPELDHLRRHLNSKGLKAFFSNLMTMDKSRQNAIAHESVESAIHLVDKDQAFGWITKLNSEYPGDIGILSPIILNLVVLKPGEAIYLPPGELHAYLDGLGIELMANSDNVLRGGLTPKHIDVPELLNVVNFEYGPVRKVKAIKRDLCQTVYEIPSEEFQLSVISVDKSKIFMSSESHGAEILICTEGKADIDQSGREEILSVVRGQSLFIPSGTIPYRISGNATFYAASVPL